MRKVNGYTLVAWGQAKGCVVILGVRENPYSPSGCEYVTAVMRSLDDGSWSWGHYFTTIDRAVSDWQERVAQNS